MSIFKCLNTMQLWLSVYWDQIEAVSDQDETSSTSAEVNMIYHSMQWFVMFAVYFACNFYSVHSYMNAHFMPINMLGERNKVSCLYTITGVQLYFKVSIRQFTKLDQS